MERKQSASRWEEIRHRLGRGHQWRSSCNMTEIRQRLTESHDTNQEWILNIRRQSEKQAGSAAEQIGRHQLIDMMLRPRQLSIHTRPAIESCIQLSSDHGYHHNANVDENSNPNISLPIIVNRSCPVPIVEIKQESQHDLEHDYLQLLIEYSRSTALSRAIRQWRTYPSSRRQHRLSSHNRLILIGMFRRWRHYRREIVQPTLLKCGRQLKSSLKVRRPSSVPNLKLKEICVRGQHVRSAITTSRSPISSRSTPQLPILSAQSKTDAQVPRAPSGPRTTRFLRSHRQFISRPDNDPNTEPARLVLKDAELSDRKRTGNASSSDKDVITDESRQQGDCAQNKATSNPTENVQTLNVDSNKGTPQVSEAVRLYRCRMKLGRLHYYQALLIDYGWRPWRILIELQRRRYQQAHCRFRDNIIRRYTRWWRSRLKLGREQITIALHFYRSISCRHAYRTWKSALLQIEKEIENLKARLSVHRWCQFVKQRYEEYQRMGIRPKIRKYWRRWQRIYHESRRNEYRKDLLLKVQGWLQKDDLANVI